MLQRSPRLSHLPLPSPVLFFSLASVPTIFVILPLLLPLFSIPPPPSCAPLSFPYSPSRPVSPPASSCPFASAIYFIPCAPPLPSIPLPSCPPSSSSPFPPSPPFPSLSLFTTLHLSPPPHWLLPLIFQFFLVSHHFLLLLPSPSPLLWFLFSVICYPSSFLFLFFLHLSSPVLSPL